MRSEPTTTTRLSTTGFDDPNGSAPPRLHAPGVTDFRIEVHAAGDAVRVTPIGELDLATAPALEAQLRAVGEAGARRVLLDLREVEFIDSTGIRLVLAADQRAKRDGREFAVISGPPAVQRIFEVSGLGERLAFETTA